MGEPKRFHQVTAPVHDETGLTVLYGPGELHEPGSLPDGVPYTEVLADEAQQAAAPAHAQAEDRAAAEAEKRAEFERIQTERSQPAVSGGQLATDPAVTDDAPRAGVQQQAQAAQAQKTGQQPGQAGQQPGAGQPAGQNPPPGQGTQAGQQAPGTAQAGPGRGQK